MVRVFFLSSFVIVVFNVFADIGADIHKHCSKENQDTRDVLTKTIGELFYDSYYYDVESKVQNWKYAFETICGPSASKKIANSIDKIIVNGKKSEYQRLKSEIVRISKYRSPKEELIKLGQIVKSLHSSGIQEIILDDTDDGKQEEEGPLPGVFSKMKVKGYDLLTTEALIKQGKKNSAQRKKTCTTVNKDKKFKIKGGKVLKTRHQGSIGWCYAFAAADLLSHKLGVNISPIAVANSYNDNVGDGKTKETKMDAGYAADACYYALFDGLCLEENLPANDQIFVQHKEYIDVYKSVELIKETYGADKNKILTAVCDSPDIFKIFPNAKVSEIVDIISSSSEMNFIDELIDKSCKPRLKVKEYIRFNKTICSGSGCKKGMAELDKALSDGKVASFLYPAGILSEPRNTFSSLHVSVIMGRRFNDKTGECEYLVRNSWGASCVYYKLDFYDCDPETGNFYIPEALLASSAKIITTY